MINILSPTFIPIGDYSLKNESRNAKRGGLIKCLEQKGPKSES